MQARRIIARVAVVGLVATLATSAGCGGSGNAGDSYARQSAVAQVGKMLAVYQKGGLKPSARGPKDLPVHRPGPVPPPRGMGDLEPMARGFPIAIGALRNKDVLLYWQTDLSESPEAASTVLAYAKEAPESGGEVLMRDGSTRTMTADEFRAAKKPEGAKTDDPKAT